MTRAIIRPDNRTARRGKAMANAQVTNIHGFKGMNPDDMKKSFKRLALKLHPDVSGYDSTSDMKVLNGEFAYWYAISARDYVYTQKVNEKPESKEYYYNQYHGATYVSDLSSAIEALLNSGIYTGATYDVEIVGVFIWIFGIGKEDKMAHSELRGMGFQFKMKRDEDRGETIPAWFYTPNYRRINTNTTRQYMENKYGAQKIYGHKGIGSGD